MTPNRAQNSPAFLQSFPMIPARPGAAPTIARARLTRDRSSRSRRSSSSRESSAGPLVISRHDKEAVRRLIIPFG